MMEVNEIIASSKGAPSQPIITVSSVVTFLSSWLLTDIKHARSTRIPNADSHVLDRSITASACQLAHERNMCTIVKHIFFLQNVKESKRLLLTLKCVSRNTDDSCYTNVNMQQCNQKSHVRTNRFNSYFVLMASVSAHLIYLSTQCSQSLILLPPSSFSCTHLYYLMILDRTISHFKLGGQCFVSSR